MRKVRGSCRVIGWLNTVGTSAFPSVTSGLGRCHDVGGRRRADGSGPLLPRGNTAAGRGVCPSRCRCPQVAAGQREVGLLVAGPRRGGPGLEENQREPAASWAGPRLPNCAPRPRLGRRPTGESRTNGGPGPGQQRRSRHLVRASHTLRGCRSCCTASASLRRSLAFQTL
jgi:hypothetical protein